MSVTRQVFYNTILQSVGKILSVVIGLVAIGLTTRYLGDKGYGEYTTVISFMGFFGVIADLGLYLVATKKISEPGASEQKIMSGVFGLRIVTVVLVLIAGSLLGLLFPYSHQIKSAMFIGIAAFAFVSATQALIGIFQKYLVYYQVVASETIQRLVMLGGTVLAISFGMDLVGFIWVLVAANGVHFLICLVLARKLIPFRLSVDLAYWKEILRESWPLGFSVILNLIYFRADTLILSVFRSPAEVGIYGLPYKILEILVAFPAMFAGLIMPILSRHVFTEHERYKMYLQKSLDAVLLAIIPIVTVTIYFARSIINLVGGDGFANADQVLQILIFAVAVMYLGNLFGHTVVAVGAQKRMVKGYLAGAIVGLALYVLLIPKYSYFGAATATIIVELVVFLYAYFLTSKVSNFYPTFSIVFKGLLAGIPMVAAYQYLNLNWMIEAVLGLILYAGMLILLKAIPLEFIREVGSLRASPPHEGEIKRGS